MLLFSVILDINPTLTKDDFIRLVIEWNQRSPFPDNVIPGLDWKGERNIRYGNEKLWLDVEEYRNQNIIAVRYEKTDKDGLIWDTDYVMDFSAWKMAVRLDRSFTPDAVNPDPRFSAPYFISMLIRQGYLKDDGDLPVTKEPIPVDSDSLSLVANVIKGTKKYALPVVYVSRTYYDEDPVNTKELASRLKGVAHVLAQQSNCTNPRLQQLCGDKNEYYGAVGIYFPNQTMQHRRFQYHSEKGFDDRQMERVVLAVIQYCNTQMVDTLCTWQGVNNALLRDRLISQREERLAAEAARKRAEQETTRILDTLDEKERRIHKEANDEANQLLAGFDEDMARLREQVMALMKTNEALSAENQGLRAKLTDTESVPVLYMGEEEDLSQGEIQDLLLSVLSDALETLPPKSRRADVVQDILRANDYQGQSEKRAEEIRRLMKSYTGMTGKLRQDLLHLGFRITEEGKHYKLIYHGDGRYQATIAKTPSDVRAGKKNGTLISRLCF